MIFLCDAGGEAKSAIIVSGGCAERRHDETESEFISRAQQAARSDTT